MCPCGRSCRRQCCQTSGSRGGSQSTQEQGAAAGNVLKGSRCGWSNGPHHVAAERFHHACWAPTEAQLTCSCQHLADYATVCNRQYVPQQRVPFTVSSSPTGPRPSILIILIQSSSQCISSSPFLSPDPPLSWPCCWGALAPCSFMAGCGFVVCIAP